MWEDEFYVINKLNFFVTYKRLVLFQTVEEHCDVIETVVHYL